MEKVSGKNLRALVTAPTSHNDTSWLHSAAVVTDAASVPASWLGKDLKCASGLPTNPLSQHREASGTGATRESTTLPPSPLSHLAHLLLGEFGDDRVEDVEAVLLELCKRFCRRRVGTDLLKGGEQRGDSGFEGHEIIVNVFEQSSGLEASVIRCQTSSQQCSRGSEVQGVGLRVMIEEILEQRLDGVAEFLQQGEDPRTVGSGEDGSGLGVGDGLVQILCELLELALKRDDLAAGRWRTWRDGVECIVDLDNIIDESVEVGGKDGD